MPIVQIAIGTRFGRLVTVSEPFVPEPRGRGSHSRIKVICDCGTSKVLLTSDLIKGSSRSCGCLARELSRNRVWIGDCGDDRCTKQHDASIANYCPAARERSNRRLRRRGYVYAIVVDETHLKIGYSTAIYERQKTRIRYSFCRLGFGKAIKATMIWHHLGDKSLETFLQWRAGRLWTTVGKGTRHSEWFKVAGVSSADIGKHLRRWYGQIELLDRWDADQAATLAGDNEAREAVSSARTGEAGSS